MEARRKHFLDIENIGGKLLAQLEGEGNEFPGDNKSLSRQFRSRGWTFRSGKLGPLRWEPSHSETGISKPWFEIEAHPLFECLRLHVPGSALWESFDKLKRRIQEVLGLTLAIEIDDRGEKSLVSKKFRDRVFREFEEGLPPEVKEEGRVGPQEGHDVAISSLTPLTNAIENPLTLAIRRRVFPGKCPACPD